MSESLQTGSSSRCALKNNGPVLLITVHQNGNTMGTTQGYSLFRIQRALPGKKALPFMNCLIAIVFFSSVSFAQWQWSAQAGGTEGFFGNYASAVCAAPNGDYAFAGTICRQKSFGMPDTLSDTTGKVLIGVYSSAGALRYVRRINEFTTRDVVCKNIAFDNNGTLFAAMEWCVFKLSSTEDPEKIITMDTSYVTTLAISGNTLLLGGIYYSYDDTTVPRTGCRYIPSLLRYSTDGTCQGRTAIGTTRGYCEISAIAVLPNGNITVAVSWQGMTAADSLTLADSTYYAHGSKEAFLVCLDSAGTHQWTLFLGGPGDEEISALAAAGIDGVFAAGSFEDNAFIRDRTLRSRGGTDNFVLQANASGHVAFLGTFGSHLTDDRCEAAGVDKSGHLWLTGKSGDSTVLANRCVRSGGSANAFLFSFDAAGEPLTAMMLGGTTLAEGRGVACGTSGVVMAGYFSGSMEVGATVLAGQSSTGFDFFIASLDPSLATPFTKWPAVPAGAVTPRAIFTAKKYAPAAVSLFDLSGRRISAINSAGRVTGILISRRAGNNHGRTSCFLR